MTSSKKFRAAILIAGSALLLPGCMQGGPGDSCRSKSDCEPGLLCTSGFSGSTCKPGCEGDSDCAAGSICVTGFLSFDQPDGQCVPGCRSSEQCAGDETCRDDRCVHRCNDDTQCGSGNICDDGACQSG